MKLIKSLTVLFVILLIQITAFALPGTAVVGTNTTNPGALATLVTVTLPASGSSASPASANYTVKLWYSCSVAASYELLIQNASGTTMSTVILPCSTGLLNQVDPGPMMTFPIQDGWKLNVTNINAFTGTGQASIFYAKETLN
jgi:hypothetical protein